MRLLIVDDEEATCQGMRVRVQSMNLPALTDIDLAFSAEEALALAQKKRGSAAADRHPYGGYGRFAAD